MPHTLNSVLLVDDHWLFLEGFKAFFEHHYNNPTVHVVDSAEIALAVIEQNLDIDLMMLDLEMPGMSGVEFLDELSQRKVFIPAIVVSSSDYLPDIHAALRKGAMGFIPKSMRSEELEAAIDHVVKGNVYIPSEFKQGLADLDRARSSVRLSTRKLQVLEAMHSGKSNKEIADELFITLSAVKGHITNIFYLLNVNNRVACLRKAEQLGFIR